MELHQLGDLGSLSCDLSLPMISRPWGSLALCVLFLWQESLDFFTWWLCKKKEKVEAVGLLRSRIPQCVFYNIQLTKAHSKAAQIQGVRK